ncbi:type VI secretion system protein TssA [Castellaniella sp.]|uniref:type VI secretion system protein TssA n=1 Tax=Castellaniella sp. TaxID=1955812 RepID=UPI002AFFAA51|nr:type VI secretion system protein TssA [Castellaniella sp.]
MTTINTEPLLHAISEQAPGGTDIRDGEAYEALSSEIEKMASPTSDGQIDWTKIETLASRILAEQSKDFMVAAWLSAAWIHHHGIDGLAAGLHLYEQLVAQFWDSAQPPLKRLRGRRNALIWGIERASGWLEQQDLAPLPVAFHAAMLADIQSLDARLAELDPDSPPLQALMQQIRRLPTEEPDPVDAPEAVSPPIATAQASPSPSTTAPGSPAIPAATAIPTATAAAPATAPGFAPTANGTQPLDSPDAAIQALRPALEYIAQINGSLRTLNPLNPISVDLCRLTARCTILESPPAQQGLTALMAPPVAIQDAFGTIMQNSNPDGLVEFCESRLGTFPYWLDLDRESARGFALMGAAGAPLRQKVIEHALSFTQRLPNIEHLAFSDGTPFADEATRQWLASSRAEREAGSSAPLDRPGQTQQQAQAALAAGHPEQALAAYQTLIETTWAGRDRFLARLALLEALPGLAAGAAPYPLARHLADECQTHKLDSWEPDLARRCWQAIYRALRNSLNKPADTANPAQESASRDLMAQAQLALAGLAPGAMV